MNTDHPDYASHGNREIRPNKRDFGFILIGLAYGIILGCDLGSFLHGDHHVFLLILSIGLSFYSVRLIRSCPDNR